MIGGARTNGLPVPVLKSSLCSMNQPGVLLLTLDGELVCCRLSLDNILTGYPNNIIFKLIHPSGRCGGLIVSMLNSGLCGSGSSTPPLLSQCLFHRSIMDTGNLMSEPIKNAGV